MDVKFYIDRTNTDYTSDDKKQVLKDISELSDILGYLMNILAEKKIVTEEYKYPISILINKFILHVYSIIDLLNGRTIKSDYLGFQKNIIDISSIYTLTRTAIENYLTFFYLYVQPSDNEEVYFRYQLLELAGLHSRQRNKAEIDEHINLKEDERKKINELENIIYNHPLFNNLNRKTRNNIQGRKAARIFTWEKLLQEADLNLDLFEAGWFLYSEFVHSEFVSHIQLYGYFSEELSSLDASDTVSNLLLALTSVFIFDLANLFKEVEGRYNSLDENVKETINFFNGVGRKELPAGDAS
jgi:hypothetical protein